VLGKRINRVDRLAEFAKIIEIMYENYDLRKMLWLLHASHHDFFCADSDGEMRCNKCMIDFKRDKVEDIKRVLFGAKGFE